MSTRSASRTLCARATVLHGRTRHDRPHGARRPPLCERFDPFFPFLPFLFPSSVPRLPLFSFSSCTYFLITDAQVPRPQYAHRVWVVSEKSKTGTLIAGVISVLTVVQFAFGAAVTGKIIAYDREFLRFADWLWGGASPPSSSPPSPPSPPSSLSPSSLSPVLLRTGLTSSTLPQRASGSASPPLSTSSSARATSTTWASCRSRWPALSRGRLSQ